MVNKVPKDITAGTANRGSTVHASDADIPGILSRGHLEEDISRVQSAANPHDGANLYKVGDLVTENNQVYICKVQSSGAFTLSNWRIVNNSNLFDESTASPSALGSQEILAYTRSGADGVPESVLAFDISRAQSAVQIYDNLSNYDVGDFTLFDDLMYRCIEANSTEDFDITKWIPVGGVGSKNVKHIFTEADFPAAVDIDTVSMHPLEDGIHYIIANPTTVAIPLFIDAGFKIEMSAFSKESNELKYSGSGAFIRSRDAQSFFTAVSNDGGQLQFATTDTLGLEVGSFVNILPLDDTTYKQTKAIVTAVDTDVSFNIAGAFTDDLTGGFDRNILVLEMANTAFEATMTSSLFDLSFTFAGDNEFYMFHCEVEDFASYGIINKVDLFIMRECEIVAVEGPLSLDQCRTLNLLTNRWFSPVTGTSTSSIMITGSLLNAVINDNTFDTPDVGDAALFIQETGSSGVGPNARIMVLNNADLRSTSTTLFQTTGDGMNETDPRVSCKFNVRQKDSYSAITIKQNFGTGSTQVVTAGADELVPINNNFDFTFTSTGNVEESFVINDATDGTIVYTGILEIFASVNYSISYTNNNNGINNFLVEKSEGEIDTTTNLVGGSGYQQFEAVTLSSESGTGGTGATGTAVISAGGIVQSLTITDGGTGYLPGDVIFITGDLSGANNSNVDVDTIVFAEVVSTNSFTKHSVDDEFVFAGNTSNMPLTKNSSLRIRVQSISNTLDLTFISISFSANAVN